MDFNSRIFVAGHNGLVGRAIVKGLTAAGYTNLLLQSRSELDLLNSSAVERFFLNEKPEYVFLAAAKAFDEFNDRSPRLAKHEQHTRRGRVW